MEGGIVLLILLIFGVPLAVAIWLIVRAINAGRKIEELSRRINLLEKELLRLEQGREQTAKVPEYRPVAPPPPRVESPPEPTKPFVPSTAPPPISTPQQKPPEPVRTPPIAKPEPIVAQSTPPPIPETARAPQPAPSRINWEQFLGVKMFAWAAGLALFLGVAFFVKYSFDKNYISPELRVAIGFIVGLGLLVGGVMTSRKNYFVLSHTLCATGVVILYAVTFACRSIYHFEFFGPLPTFLLMVLITTTAFLLAVRLNALVVAILGMLGGFLTPILLSTGVDNPGGLFGYIAILDIGLIIVAVYRRWFFLTMLAAFATMLMQIGWALKFFVAGKYFEGDKIFIALAVLLGFNLLYLAAAGWLKRRGQTDHWLSGSMLGLAAVALGFTLAFLTFPPLAHRPWLMFGFVFVIDACVIALVLLDSKVTLAQPLAGLAVFGLLTFWTVNSLTNDFLNAALTFYFIFAVVHAVFPVVLQRLRGVTTALWGSQIFPPLALALVLVPILHLAEVSFIVWPFVLLVDILAIALAVMTASILSVVIALLLTLAATGALIFKIPETLTGLPTSFLLLAAFAIFFFAISMWLIRKYSPAAFKTGLKFGENLANPSDVAALLPACSAVLPFLLLIMATLRLPLTNPSPVFGLTLLLVALLLGVTTLLSLDWMPAIALVCVAALECAWHFNRFEVGHPNISPQLPLIWYLVFYGVFVLFPFLWLRKFADKIVPWAAAAMAGPLQFFLIYRLIKIAYPNQMMGLVPAAFVLPALLSLVVTLKKIPPANPARISQLAWFGGVALFFITLIFPIQFDKQWITIGWALEGAALLWLFHRVPHPGLRLVGFGLLVAAFVRLAFNPYVLEYHPRAATAIFNWYLYAYGIVTVCLFVGAALISPPRNRILNINAQPVLFTLGTVLAFLC